MEKEVRTLAKNNNGAYFRILHARIKVTLDECQSVKSCHIVSTIYILTYGPANHAV